MSSMVSLEFLNAFSPVSEADLEALSAALASRQFAKGTLLVSPGEVQREMYFVTKGIQMSYFESESKNHVIAFTYPPGPCAIPGSFSFQKESAYYLQCMTDSEMAAISYANLMELLDQSHALERLFRKMTEVFLDGMITRHIELHALSMEERFLAFMKRSSHLLQQIPHKYIASYLGIDPTNFSKLYNSIRI